MGHNSPPAALPGPSTSNPPAVITLSPGPSTSAGREPNPRPKITLTREESYPGTVVMFRPGEIVRKVQTVKGEEEKTDNNERY